MWKPGLDATMESVKNAPGFDPTEVEKTKKILAQIVPMMRLKIDSDTLEMKRKSRSQSMPYTLVEKTEEMMHISLQAGPDRQIPCKIRLVGKERIKLKIEGNNDMDHYVWEPAESMETAAPNMAAITAAAIEESSTPKSPAESVSKLAREKMIRNNLRQIASAADQYFLENGVDEAAYADLEGEYFKPLKPVNGEDYSTLVIKFREEIKVVDKDGKEHVYSK